MDKMYDEKKINDAIKIGQIGQGVSFNEFFVSSGFGSGKSKFCIGEVSGDTLKQMVELMRKTTSKTSYAAKPIDKITIQKFTNIIT